MSHGLRLALLGLVPLAVFLLGLFLFRAILLPFLVGMAAAYLLDPAADRLQRWGLGRTVATLAITIVFVLVLLVVLIVILPPLATQAAELARDLPGYLEQLRRRTGDRSLESNRSLLLANARLAGQLAVELAEHCAAHHTARA